MNLLQALVARMALLGISTPWHPRLAALQVQDPGTQLLGASPCCSPSPKAGHNKAGRSDFQNWRFEPDTGKMRKMRNVPLTPEKQWSEEIPQSKNAENAANADTKTRKIRLRGFNVTGLR